MRSIGRFIRREEAATSVEYAVMLALILLAVLVAVGAVGARTASLWGNAAASMP
jgi:pilus assembly protein Flp/PilA